MTFDDAKRVSPLGSDFGMATSGDYCPGKYHDAHLDVLCIEQHAGRHCIVGKWSAKASVFGFYAPVCTQQNEAF